MSWIEKILRKFGYIKYNRIEDAQVLIQRSGDHQEAGLAPCQKVVLPKIELFSSTGDTMTLHSADFGTIPKNRTVIPLSKQQKSDLYGALSSASGVAANVGGEATVVSGLYRATASASQLIKYSDGTIGSMVMEGGKISAHAGFTAAGAAALLPVAVFSVLSTVTGQYYLKDIKKQLNQLNSRIEDLIQKVEARNRGMLDAIYWSLRIIEKQRSFTVDDLVFIRTQSANALSLYYNYIEQLKIKLSDESVEQIQSESKSIYPVKASRKVKEALEGQDLTYLVTMANASYTLYALSELLYFKELCLMSDLDPSYLVKVQDTLQTLGTIHAPEHIALLGKFKATVNEWLKKLPDNVLIGNGKLETNRSLIEEHVKNLHDSAVKTDQSITQIQTSVLKPFNEEKDIYYDLTIPGEVTVYLG